MRISGQSEAAETWLRAAPRQEPANVEARLNLVGALLQDERGDEVIALLDPGVTPAGDARVVRHWILQRSLAPLQMGLDADAAADIAALERMGPTSEDIAPLWRWRRVLIALALCEGSAGRQEDPMGRAERSLAQGRQRPALWQSGVV